MFTLKASVLPEKTAPLTMRPLPPIPHPAQNPFADTKEKLRSYGVTVDAADYSLLDGDDAPSCPSKEVMVCARIIPAADVFTSLDQKVWNAATTFSWKTSADPALRAKIAREKAGAGTRKQKKRGRAAAAPFPKIFGKSTTKRKSSTIIKGVYPKRKGAPMLIADYVIPPRPHKNSPQIGGGKRCPYCNKFMRQFIVPSKANKLYTAQALFVLERKTGAAYRLSCAYQVFVL